MELNRIPLNEVNLNKMESVKNFAKQEYKAIKQAEEQGHTYQSPVSNAIDFQKIKDIVGKISADQGTSPANKTKARKILSATSQELSRLSDKAADVFWKTERFSEPKTTSTEKKPSESSRTTENLEHIDQDAIAKKKREYAEKFGRKAF